MTFFKLNSHFDLRQKNSLHTFGSNARNGFKRSVRKTMLSTFRKKNHSNPVCCVRVCFFFLSFIALWFFLSKCISFSCRFLCDSTTFYVSYNDKCTKTNAHCDSFCRLRQRNDSERNREKTRETIVSRFFFSSLHSIAQIPDECQHKT